MLHRIIHCVLSALLLGLYTTGDFMLSFERLKEFFCLCYGSVSIVIRVLMTLVGFSIEGFTFSLRISGTLLGVCYKDFIL